MSVDSAKLRYARLPIGLFCHIHRSLLTLTHASGACSWATIYMHACIYAHMCDRVWVYLHPAPPEGWYTNTHAHVRARNFGAVRRGLLYMGVKERAIVYVCVGVHYVYVDQQKRDC